MSKIISIVLIIVVIAVVMIMTGGSNSSSITMTDGEVVDFSVVNYDGENINLSDFRGTPVFVNFWATWCPFCVNELPLMAGFQKEYGAQYVTLAVNRGEDQEESLEFVRELGIAEDLTFVIDENDEYFRELGGRGMPYSLFLDGEGKVVSKITGPLNETSMRENITNILPI